MEPRLLRPEDIPAAEHLSTMAGWNQTPEDWQRVLTLAPEGSWGIEVRGLIVATATGIRREDGLVWIGMVLTHPDWRGRGFASTLMCHILNTERERGTTRFGLDATALGKPIYEKLGFRAAYDVERWRRQGRAVTAEGYPAGRRFEIDQAWAEARPGRVAGFFGPAMADTPDELEEMVEWFLAQYGHEPTLWDLDPHHPFASEVAAAYGFEANRWLLRMYLGEAEAPNPRAVAYEGFEYPPCA